MRFVTVFCFLLCLNAFSFQMKPFIIVSEYYEGGSEVDGTGYYQELGKLLLDRDLAQPLQFKIAPFARAIRMLETGEADALIGAYQGEVDGIYPKHHIDEDYIALLQRPDSPSIQEPSQLREKRYGWVRGYSFDVLFTLGNPIYYKDLQHGLTLLRGKRIDYLIDDAGEIDGLLETIPKQEYSNFVKQALGVLPIYYVFGKQHANIAELFDQRFEEVLQDKSLQRLYKKHDGYPNYQPQTSLFSK